MTTLAAAAPAARYGCERGVANTLNAKKSQLSLNVSSGTKYLQTKATPIEIFKLANYSHTGSDLIKHIET